MSDMSSGASHDMKKPVSSFRSLWYLFPPFLIVKCISSLFQHFLGPVIMRHIHPKGEVSGPRGFRKGPLYHQENNRITKDNYQTLVAMNNLNTELVLYPCKQGVVELIAHEESSEISDQQKILICFSGNDTCYTQQSKIFSFMEESKYSRVIFVNHPDVGLSARFDRKRNSMQDLYYSGQVAVEHIMKKNPKADITIYGHSLGGAVASRVAKSCHQQDKTPSLIVDRTLSTVPDFILGHILFCPKILWPILLPLSVVILPLVSVVLRLSRCHISGAWDYFSLPKSNRHSYESKKDHVMKPRARLSHSWFCRKVSPDIHYFGEKKEYCSITNYHRDDLKVSPPASVK